jgi:hypothetical protein
LVGVAEMWDGQPDGLTTFTSCGDQLGIV